MTAQFDLASLLLRLVLGLFLAAHGYNKFFGGGRLQGTAGWFGAIGMRWPKAQAFLAASTEVGAGLLLAAGALTPFAAAGVIGVMVVAIRVAHWRTGFFIFRQPAGWEYCGTVLFGALTVGIMGPGRWSVDHALDIHWEWWGLAIALVLGVGGALVQLAVSYRPAPTS